MHKTQTEMDGNVYRDTHTHNYENRYRGMIEVMDINDYTQRRNCIV